MKPVEDVEETFAWDYMGSLDAVGDKGVNDDMPGRPGCGAYGRSQGGVRSGHRLFHRACTFTFLTAERISGVRRLLLSWTGGCWVARAR
jgi:hypothetical protein